MLVQTRPKVAHFSRSRRFASGDGDIDRRQAMLVQTKGLARQALDAVARDGGAEGAGRDAQPQPRMSFLIDEYGETEECIRKATALLSHVAKFGRLMQTLARLERQFTDRSSSKRNLRAEFLAALGATTCQQCAAAFRCHAGTKSVGTGTMQIAGVESTFHSATRAKTAGQINGLGRFTRGGKGTERAWMCQ